MIEQPADLFQRLSMMPRGQDEVIVLLNAMIDSDNEVAQMIEQEAWSSSGVYVADAGVLTDGPKECSAVTASNFLYRELFVRNKTEPYSRLPFYCTLSCLNSFFEFLSGVMYSCLNSRVTFWSVFFVSVLLLRDLMFQCNCQGRLCTVTWTICGGSWHLGWAVKVQISRSSASWVVGKHIP